MTQYILGTDHLSLYQREKQEYHRIRARIETHPAGSTVITVISVEEQMPGRLAQLSRARKTAETIDAYWWLRKTVLALNRFPILEFEEAAQRHFERLKSLKIRVGTADLRIAAIALATDSVLVTRNAQDFDAIPGLVSAQRAGFSEISCQFSEKGAGTNPARDSCQLSVVSCQNAPRHPADN